MLDGFRNPKHVKTGIDVVRFKKLAESSGMAVAEKKFGAKIREIFLESTKRGVLKEDNQLITETGSKLLNKSQGEKFLDKTKNVGIDIATAKGLLPAREQVFRVAHFADTIDRTGSMDEAAAAVKRTLFEYQELAPTERNVFKRIIPFYSFMRKNAEFHLNNFAKSPGKYTALQHFLDNSKNLGADMTEEDWAAMPAWMKTGMAVATQKKDGKATLLTGFGLPTEAIGGLFGGEEGSLKSAGQNMLASSSPLAKIPLEMLTGKSFFSGKDIDENRYGGRYADMPKPLRDLLGYRENEKTSKDGSKYKQQTVDPMRAYIANNAPGLAPLLTQYKRILDAKEDPKNLVNLLSGARTYTRDIEQEKASREREMQEEIQRELFRRGIGSYYTNYNLGEEGRRELINN